MLTISSPPQNHAFPHPTIPTILIFPLFVSVILMDQRYSLAQKSSNEYSDILHTKLVFKVQKVFKMKISSLLLLQVCKQGLICIPCMSWMVLLLKNDSRMQKSFPDKISKTDVMESINYVISNSPEKKRFEEKINKYFCYASTLICITCSL